MNLIPNEFYHIYNRGNNRQRIFFSDANYLFFIQKIRDQLLPVSKIISYCLMPNHFHLIIMATEKSVEERATFGGKPMQEFAYRIGILLSSYTQAINKQNKTTGSMFQQKTNRYGN
jgi:putative transposase